MQIIIWFRSSGSSIPLSLENKMQKRRMRSQASQKAKFHFRFVQLNLFKLPFIFSLWLPAHAAPAVVQLFI